ncbi:hypothetical protein [Hymenobacter persicinus]|uniref:DUF4890 domain-containing protein n=1 Tax=Hymenobacter persicinus TaxID=2025506 RepID=A0A4Q5LAX8_9BACT|nr:hypothetical protein [Hymenobacter persicinus]RYU78099.1 hypothetical protein EWM57_15340 [Hymenobacter persicinus]
MLSARPLLFLALFSTLTFSCARRNKANIPEAKSVAVAPAPAAVPKAAARDLADVMTDELGLSADQQTKVRSILRSTVEQVNDARQRFGTDKVALNTELRRINTSAESDLRTVLSAEQYKQYQTKKRAMQAQMQAKRAAVK